MKIPNEGTGTGRALDTWEGSGNLRYRPGNTVRSDLQIESFCL